MIVTTGSIAPSATDSEIAVFIGPGSRERAIRYAHREYGAFDEIELEPYPRSRESQLGDTPRQ